MNQELYAMYLRKSRADMELEELGEGETLTRHYNTLLALANKKEILTSQITVYREVVSGESIAARPEMQRLLNDLYQKKYKAVLCMEVERLARGNTKDQGEVADAFTYSGTHIITPVKEYDPLNEYDQEYFEFGLFMSRREYKTIRRRMEAGRLQSLREGNYVGSLRPYGYDIQRISKKERILVENEAEGRVVRLIYDWFTADRSTCGQIARKLTDMGIPTQTGNKEWNRATVKDILQNDHYTGKVRWNRRKRSKEYDENGMIVRKRRLTADEFEVHEGKHKAIISQEQFDLAQTLFTAEAPVKAMTDLTNPLAGLLFCADCGKAIALQTYPSRKNTQPRYTHKPSSLCNKKSCNADVLIASLTAALQSQIEDAEVKLNSNSVNEERKRSELLLDSLSAELAKTEKRKQRLFDSWEADDGTYTHDEFISRKQMYDQSIADIKKQIQEAKAAIPESVDYEKSIFTLKKIIEKLNDTTLSARAKNEFLKDNIKVIKYDAVDLGRQNGCEAHLDVFLK